MVSTVSLLDVDLGSAWQHQKNVGTALASIHDVSLGSFGY